MEPVRLGILGLGTVGAGLCRMLARHNQHIDNTTRGPVIVERALVRSLEKERDLGDLEIALTTDPNTVIQDPNIDIIVELTGGVDPTRSWLESALRAKKHVVTANKDLIAQHGTALQKLADEEGVSLHYEAAAAGGIPIVKALRESLVGNRIHTLLGIINGTTNYILTDMTRNGTSFADSLAEAQALGYAESDPTSDVEGIDVAYKLSILASLAFGSTVDFAQIARQGISTIGAEDIHDAAGLGYVIKLLAIASQERGDNGENLVQASVQPTLVPTSHPLASVDGVFNAVFVQGDAVGDMMFYGRGAGADPTASAVMADVVDACQNVRGRTKRFTPSRPEAHVLPSGEAHARFYISIQCAEKPGALASIATSFAAHGVSIESVIQKGHQQDPVRLVFVTHSARTQSIQDALGEIRSLSDVYTITNALRVIDRDA